MSQISKGRPAVWQAEPYKGCCPSQYMTEAFCEGIALIRHTATLVCCPSALALCARCMALYLHGARRFAHKRSAWSYMTICRAWKPARRLEAAVPEVWYACILPIPHDVVMQRFKHRSGLPLEDQI
jgi:hypothetical protein